MKALLIIDMQRGSFTSNTPRYDSIKVIGRINELASTFKKRGDLVLFIQHDGSANGDFVPGSEDWKLLPEFAETVADGFIAKTANDCFYQSTLNDVLRKYDVENVVITGCATDFCVDTTVKAAATHGYTVTVIADAHTTADRDGVAAGPLIQHYNWVWKNMLPVSGKHIEVINCQAYLSERISA